MEIPGKLKSIIDQAVIKSDNDNKMGLTADQVESITESVYSAVYQYQEEAIKNLIIENLL